MERSREHASWFCAQIVGDDILDLDCGLGYLSIAAAHHAERVVGVDCEPTAIEEAQKLRLEQPPEIQRRLRFLVADIDDNGSLGSELAQKKFDTILFQDAWDHVDPSQDLRKCFDLLRDTGRIVTSFSTAAVSTNTEDALRSLLASLDDVGAVTTFDVADEEIRLVFQRRDAERCGGVLTADDIATAVRSRSLDAAAWQEVTALRRERDRLRTELRSREEELEEVRTRAPEVRVVRATSAPTRPQPGRIRSGFRAVASTLELEVRSGRIIRHPVTSMRKTYARLRKAVSTLPEAKPESKSLYSIELEAHRLMPLVRMANQRPIETNQLQAEIESTFWVRNIDAELTFVLEEMLKNDALRSDAANLFLAATRALCEKDLARGLAFADALVPALPDERVLRSLTTYWGRAGNPTRALAMLELVRDRSWAEKRRQAIQSRLAKEQLDVSPEAFVARYFGHRALREDPEEAVLLYGDIDLNSIDGSSIWLASVAEVLAGSGIKVHFLLKANIERPLLLEPLLHREDIELLEPRIAGYERLTPQQAIRVIESLDGILGGYRTIVLRGMSICRLAAARKSLSHRIWAYLTDFYGIDGEDGGRLVLAEDSAASFANFRHSFSKFLVQTPQIAEVIQNRFGIEAEAVLNLPPMIPDSVAWKEECADRGDESVWRLAYAGKIAPQWGVLELIALANELGTDGHAIEVHIIGDKIHANSESHPTFEEDIAHAIETSPHVTWHKALSRSETLDLMCHMDLAWCYRDPALERHTLELSTKLLECLAIQVPMVLTRNRINEDLLGTDYPLFVSSPEELGGLLRGLVKSRALPNLGDETFSNAVAAHRISHVRSHHLAPAVMDCKRLERPQRVVLAGHDLKFIGEFESHLKSLGHIVRRDDWEWGEPKDEHQSKLLSEWADTVFCEWSLANAVWYSKNLDPKKRLVIRLHSQEIHKRAKVFPPRLNFESIDKIVFVSDHIRRVATERLDWSDKPLTTIPNYVNCDLFDRPKLPTAAFAIGFVGCVPEMKRLDRALDFISALRKRDPRFTLIIKGKLPKDYGWMQNRASEMQYYDEQFERIDSDEYLRDGVLFSEHSPQIAEWYREVACVLSPSDFESFHYTIAEGAASGAMPIIWPWDGARELFPPEWTVETTEEAVERALLHLGENWNATAAASLYQAPMRSQYDMQGVFERLAREVLDGAAPSIA